MGTFGRQLCMPEEGNEQNFTFLQSCIPNKFKMDATLQFSSELIFLLT